MDARIIFSTIHGSYLYGLAHEHSDKDVFEVITSERRKAHHQVIEAGLDVVRVPWNVFLTRISEGSHQSVEALFSHAKVWGETGEPYRAMLQGYRVCGADVFAKYERTIRTFARADFKRRRHAVRLHQNLQELRKSGRFEPRMSVEQRGDATRLALQYHGEQLLARLEGRAWGRYDRDLGPGEADTGNIQRHHHR